MSRLALTAQSSPRPPTPALSSCGTSRAASRSAALRAAASPLAPTARCSRRAGAARSSCGTWRTAPRSASHSSTKVESAAWRSVPTVRRSPRAARIGSSLWEFANRAPIGEQLQGHSSPVTSVVFSPDGETLASGSSDGTVVLWSMGRAAWSDAACRIANRNLSQREWQQFLGDEDYHETCPGLPTPEFVDQGSSP